MPQKSIVIKGLTFFCLIINLGTCNIPTSSPSPSSATPTAAITATDSLPSLTPTAPEPTPIPRITLVTTGVAEVVFDWSVDRCEELDIPDLPVRAFRDGDGNVQLISKHYDNRRFIGPNLNEVSRDCQIVMRSTHDGDPSQYNDNQWLASTYTEDGRTIHAVAHQEYHGWEHGETCPGENFACWYNALTMAVSTDGGNSYQNIVEPPAHLIATLPIPYEAGAGPYGVMEPSNIIKRSGYYYLFVRIDDYKSDSQRICLMRTDDLNDPSAWRAWDGSDFTVETVNPYLNPELIGRACSGLDSDLGVMNSSVTYNTLLNLYVMVGVTALNRDGREVWGVLYAFSPDLIHWEPRQLLVEVELPWTYQPGDGSVFLYPALLDPDSESRNFETTDATAYLYLTRFNEDYHLDRDLIRIPVEFFLSETAAREAEIPFMP